MSAADSIGKGQAPVPISGPAGLATLVIGFGRAIIGQDRTKKFKIDGRRVSRAEFRGGGGGSVLQQAAAAAQRIAAQRNLPVGVVAAGPPTDAEWERRRREAGYGKKPPPPKPNPPPPGLPPTTLPRQIPTTTADRARARIAVPPRATAATLRFAGKWLRAAGWTGTIIYTVEWIAEKWAEFFPGQPLPDGPPPPRAGGPGSQGGKGSNRPPLPPEIIFSPVINVNVPGPAPEPKPKAPRPPVVNPAAGLERIKITARRVPIPSPVPPAPKPASPLTTLLSKYGSSAIPFLAALGKQAKKKKKRPSSSPAPGIPGLTPGQNPELGLLPQLADYPFVSGGNYFDSTVTQPGCDCGPKKKKKGPKKKRAVCYTGRFTEKANGLRKYEKRKIKCR